MSLEAELKDGAIDEWEAWEFLQGPVGPLAPRPLTITRPFGPVQINHTWAQCQVCRRWYEAPYGLGTRVCSHSCGWIQDAIDDYKDDYWSSLDFDYEPNNERD